MDVSRTRWQGAGPGDGKASLVPDLDGSGPLTEETTLSVVYSGSRDVTEQDGRVFIASDGSDNPRSKPIGKPRKGWAPD